MFKAKKTLSKILITALLISIFPAISSFAGATYPGLEDLPYVQALPNPFEFRDGSMVKSAEDWAARREELKDMFRYYEFGYTHEPDTLTATRTDNTLKVTMTKNYPNPGDPNNPIVRTGTFSVTFTIPTAEQLAGTGLSTPFPAFVGGGPTNYQQKGYAACGWPTTASDTTADRTGAYYDLFPYEEGSLEYDTGTLIARAWGMSRLIDALSLKDDSGSKLFPEIDETKLIAYGFSRSGKIALLAAAFDERVAMAWLGHSGQCGASGLRYTHNSKKYPVGNNANYSSYTVDEINPDTFFSARTGLRKEQMSQAQGSYGPWFTSRLKQFTNETKEYFPLDHHELLALVAPRPLFVCEGMDDFWNGPESVAINVAAVKPVYELLGAEGNVGLSISPKLRHATNDYERAYALAMADRAFRGIDPNFGEPYTFYPSNPIIYQDFQYHPFTNIDPTAIPWSGPDQYGVATVSKRVFVEGMDVTIPVISDADKVTMIAPDGTVIKNKVPIINSKAEFRVHAKEAAAGVYTILAEGKGQKDDKRSREIKIECITMDFLTQPEILLEDEAAERSWYLAWPERINMENVKVSLDTRSNEELALDFKATRIGSTGELNQTQLTVKPTERALQIQHYGFMIRQFGISQKLGKAVRWDDEKGTIYEVPFEKPSYIIVEGIEFPDLFPGQTFDYKIAIPESLDN